MKWASIWVFSKDLLQIQMSNNCFIFLAKNKNKKERDRDRETKVALLSIDTITWVGVLVKLSRMMKKHWEWRALYLLRNLKPNANKNKKHALCIYPTLGFILEWVTGQLQLQIISQTPFLHSANILTLQNTKYSSLSDRRYTCPFIQYVSCM